MTFSLPKNQFPQNNLPPKKPTPKLSDPPKSQIHQTPPKSQTSNTAFPSKSHSPPKKQQKKALQNATVGSGVWVHPGHTKRDLGVHGDMGARGGLCQGFVWGGDFGTTEARGVHVRGFSVGDMGTLGFPVFSKILFLEKPRIFSKGDMTTSGTLGHRQDSCQELLHESGHGDIGISEGDGSHWGLPWGRDPGDPRTLGPRGTTIRGFTSGRHGHPGDHSGGPHKGFLWRQGHGDIQAGGCSC